MAPRPVRRRPTRFSVREPDTPSNSNPLTFQKPNLPPLQGTPSSRRQYSYGAEVEPMPSRPGHGLSRNQARDIGSAVRNVLKAPGVNDEEEDHHQDRQEKTQKPQGPKLAQPELDELAGNQLSQSQHLPSYLSGNPVTGLATRPLLSLRNPRPDGSDGDDARSFGIESDFYGDATITSTPRAPPPQRPELSDELSIASAPANGRLSHSVVNKLPAVISEDEEVDLVKQPQAAYKGPAKIVGPSPLRAPPRRPPQLPAQQPRFEQEEEEEDEEEEDEENEQGTDATDEHQEGNEEDDLVEHQGPRPIAQTNTPAPGRSQPELRDHIQRTRMGGPSLAQAQPKPIPRLQPPNTSASTLRSTEGLRSNQVRRSQLSTRAQLEPRPRTHPERRDQGSEENSSEDGRWLDRAAATTTNLFAQAKFLVNSSPFSLGRRYPGDDSERDTAIQRDIAQAETEVARERLREENEAAYQRSYQRWSWLKSFFTPFTGRRQSQHGNTAAPGSNRRSMFALLRLLNPMIYLRAIVWLIQALLDWIMQVVHFIIPAGVWDQLSSVFGFLPHILAGGLAFVMAFAFATQLAGSTDSGWPPQVMEAALRTFDDLRYGVSGLIPTVTWPKRDRWVDLENLWEDDDSSRNKLQHFLSRMEEEFLTLKRSGKIHDASLKKLEKILPSIVHMDLRDGRPVISEEFWHALRDLIHEDGGFLAFDKFGSEYAVSSDRQWSAITSRLLRDPAFTNKLNLTASGIEDRLSRKMITFWDKWVKDNDDKIAHLLGTAVDQIKSAGSQREFEDRLNRIVGEQLAQREEKEGQKGRFVSREEFTRHLTNEVASLSSQLRAELHDLQPQMERLVQRAIDAATQELTHGMSRADVTALVNSLIDKALADINLEAVALGKIHSHWDNDLRNQVNYFAVGAGAAVDPRLTSATWDPRGAAITRRRYEQGQRGPEAFPPIAALEPWQEEGDCWCAARSVNHRGNPHGATLSVQLRHSVIPQHIVVEHILPGATTQPGARPKSIEVWAEILDPEARERILDFASVYFPDDKSDWNYTPPDFSSQFVKITQFVYKGTELHRGVHVHRLNSELLALGAHTDRVVVRAVSNYGAANHTCFYRVRLYGFNVDLDPREGGNSYY
ncbi:spindle pole body-associated protein sad1 [Metarhizium album ARSEF 1941]|uniref:Spindle pole body-associated protein sad1 n=1 Tax=Metarhizium album (strain ARSEF 1941) TaxID=1081103 RepID=A0A0B2WWK9_METAS|nr:spindle pole body-associated protein sad1 [Metarhizium album ARSEF 1941]KHN98453.1 spindle pole body-associated protein sad1 [Metarhizium album ARSEF 1941]